MRLFSSELAHNYGSYTFGYCQYCEQQNGDDLSNIYAQGFLPYSGSREVYNIFYLARSARVMLADFALSSENRRIAKKFDGAFQKKRIPREQFLIDEDFLSFCLAYFAERHGEHTMPRERLLFILNSGLISTIVEYKKDGAPVAYVFEAEASSIAHYWYSFYDLSFAQQSLGLWLMLDCLVDAKARRLAHYYLGTVYGEKALYKTVFEPLEWWSGGAWERDTKLLKERGRSDASRIVPQMNAWKESQTFF
jgi:arginyl-tRNA--protein-N-Asp/Glu arginylyltransferase